jgi:serine/threonine protein kinase
MVEDKKPVRSDTLSIVLSLVEKLKYNVEFEAKVIPLDREHRISRGGFGGIYRSNGDVVKIVNGFRLSMDSFAMRKFNLLEEMMYKTEVGYFLEGDYRVIQLFPDNLAPQKHYLTRRNMDILGSIVGEIEIGKHLSGIPEVLAAKDQKFLLYTHPFGHELLLCSAYLFDYFEGSNLANLIKGKTILSATLGDKLRAAEAADEEHRSLVEAEYLGRPQTQHDEYTAKQRFEVAIRVGEALKKIWQKGIVHRDFKPSNVMVSGDPLSPDCIVKVLDFGSACLVNKGGFPISDEGKWEELNNDYSHHHVLRATREYTAPEHARKGSTRIAGDIYSYGLTVFSILSGISFFTFSNAEGFSLARACGRDENIDVNQQSMVTCMEQMGYDKLTKPMADALGKEQNRNMDALLDALKEQRRYI